MTVINGIVLWNYIAAGEAVHGVGYFIFFYVAVLTIYFFTKKITPKNDIVVKEPKKELTVALVFALLGLLFLALNFMLRTNYITNIWYTKLPVMAGSFFFSMPFGIFIYLLLKKYKLLQFGILVKPLGYLLLGVVIWGLTGFFALVFNKSGILWESGLEELGGVLGILVQGVLGAALFEEFSRFVIQSRYEKVFKTTGINILFATIIWSLMHLPVAYFQVPDLTGNLIYCLQIIPLGFVWGYLTQRTKSILPSVIAHGLNLWGLQN